MRARNDFAGAGGWELGLRHLNAGTDALAVECDRHAVATLRAAGLHAVEGDVRDVPWNDAELYTASPPCQDFSAAGKGAGRDALPVVVAAVAAIADAAGSLAVAREAAVDDRIDLVLWPLARILTHRPRLVALEQVPAVLPVWRAYAHALEVAGYSVDTAILSAEQHGVPQTRRRAILVARNDGVPAELPWPTHTRYVKGRPQHDVDPGCLPWVSMAQALGWHGLDLEQESNYSDGGGPGRTAAERGRTRRPITAPSVGITSKAHRWTQARNAGGETTARRVTVTEAAILQSFPADHPWQGHQGAQYQQVGNAIPPLLAAAVLAPLLADAAVGAPQPSLWAAS